MRRGLLAVVLRSVVLCVAMLFAPRSIVAQAPDSAPPPPGVSAALDSARALRGASLSISLLTYGPGNAVFERFGHMALAVHDSLTGEDVAFNWGMFDFSEPNFVMRFLTGDTNYWMAGFNTAAFNAHYRSENRRIRLQQIVLPAVERAALFEYVAWNARDANKFYRYDYYNDNCATRVRDAIDRVLGGRLRTALKVPGDAHTWRGETARITEGDLPTFAGIEIALGRNADKVLSKWDESFLPERLADHLSDFIVSDAQGRRYSLVKQDTVIFEPTRVPLPTEPPTWFAGALLVGLTIAGVIAALTDARPPAARAVLAAIVAVWYLLGGFLGTALLLAGTVTKHAPYMGSNTTLLQLHPLMLIALWPVTASLARRRYTRTALGLTSVLALLSVVGVVLQLIPSFAQGSSVVLAVTVPIHLALALALWRLEHDESTHRHAAMPLSRAA